MLIPEPTVTHPAASRRFYCDVLGWQVEYERPEDGFVMLRRGDVRLMLDPLCSGRNFDATLAPGDRPFGRGMNLEIQEPSLAPIRSALDDAGWPLHLPLETAWYRGGAVEMGQRQFVVADPDGYLLRFCEAVGERPIARDAL